ncbi:MAG TPA: MEDS domain-containing protein [Gemmataceae bacterium]|nr:MEDS domain-containing protein [Gemmataceae bacterium]
MHVKQTKQAGSILNRSRHVCAFFHTREEEYRVMLPFIRGGFDRGDRALHIIDARNRSDHQRRLEQVGVKVTDAETKKQLEIWSWEEAYLKDGKFDQERQIDLVAELLGDSKDRDYAMTRVVASMEWALEDRPGVEDLIEYESRVNHTLTKCDAAVCCTYNMSRFSPDIILDAMRAHPVVMVGGIFLENPFYTPPDEFLRELRERPRRADATLA